jgi:hypothetical protein
VEKEGDASAFCLTRGAKHHSLTFCSQRCGEGACGEREVAHCALALGNDAAVGGVGTTCRKSFRCSAA